MTDKEAIPNHTLKQLLPYMLPIGRKVARAFAKYEGEECLLEQGWYLRPKPLDYEDDDRGMPDHVAIGFYIREALEEGEFARAQARLHASGVLKYIERWENGQDGADQPMKFNATYTRVVKAL